MNATRAMRVAVIAYHSSPLAEPGSGDAGGMTVYVREVARSLAARGVYTDVYTRADSDGQRLVEILPGVRVIPVEAGPAESIPKDDQPRFLSDFVAGVRAFAATQRIRYDVVHSHYWQSGVAGSALAAAWAVPLVHSHHTLGRVKNQYLPPGDAPESRVRLQGEERVIATADVFVASTDDEWQYLACLYGASHDRLKTVHPGVDQSLFSPGDRVASRARLGLDPDAAILLYAGRIQRLKGIDLALRSTALLRERLDRPVTLLVVGGTSGSQGHEELRRLESLARDLDLDAEARFLGPRPHEQLPDFYRAADALTVCSYSESFGLAALEAHACGTPVVGTPVGGLSHVVRNGRSGFLVPTRDPDVFTARLHTLLTDEILRNEFSDAAVAASKAFSWDVTADGLVELYECLVEEEAPEVCTC